MEYEEQKFGGVTWLKVRAHSAEWSWLTPAEAVKLAHEWLSKYERTDNAMQQS